MLKLHFTLHNVPFQQISRISDNRYRLQVVFVRNFRKRVAKLTFTLLKSSLSPTPIKHKNRRQLSLASSALAFLPFFYHKQEVEREFQVAWAIFSGLRIESWTS
ncbi:hypothetical protein TNIN_391631 [Trichonephila inaurata madagascariensis]|uniref:Uncharacterized protein n=1 Tax=Trichonephila inaurata madagascariensis TaxID=2747483 RepID=A0A8X6X3F7_9ARAC|nr:hypothetical protein TNIN_391631 [Trichonephila inaurata madagascariensis]